MGGLGRAFFREFAVTLTIAILISLVISLTTTPCCARCCCGERDAWAAESADETAVLQGAFAATNRRSTGAPCWSRCAIPGNLVLVSLLLVIVAQRPALQARAQRPVSAAGHRAHDRQAPKPTRAFPSMRSAAKLEEMIQVVKQDPAIQSVVGFTGAGSGSSYGSTNTAHRVRGAETAGTAPRQSGGR